MIHAQERNIPMSIASKNAINRVISFAVEAPPVFLVRLLNRFTYCAARTKVHQIVGCMPNDVSL